MAELYLAASETETWFAYPVTMTRGQVIADLADGGEWFFVLHAYRFNHGWVVESEEEPGRGWWSECDDDTPGAVRAWIVRSRG